MFQAEGTACVKAPEVGKITGLREGGSGCSQGVTAVGGEAREAGRAGPHRPGPGRDLRPHPWTATTA